MPFQSSPYENTPASLSRTTRLASQPAAQSGANQQASALAQSGANQQASALAHSGSSQRMRLLAALIACLVLAAMLVLAGCTSSSQQSSASASSEPIASLEASKAPAVEDEAALRSIDFEALQEQNADVYAWIYIPNTQVNHPILQSSLIDNYYLVHDVRGNENASGAVYTQSCNSLDFTDPVTVIYGHTFETSQGVTDEMFGSLHNYEDGQFFNDNSKFYIYLPNKVLTYEVASVYEYDNRHIMNSFDFSNLEVQQNYFNYVINPDSMLKHVRPDLQLTAGTDKIVQLSTCTYPANDSARYLLTGVLVDERTV